MEMVAGERGEMHASSDVDLMKFDECLIVVHWNKKSFGSHKAGFQEGS